MVRNPAYMITSKLPKKDNLEDAKAGNKNIIIIVYASRMIFNYIKAEQEESGSNMDVEQVPRIDSLSIYEI